MKRFNLVTYEIPLPDGETLFLDCSTASYQYNNSQRVETWYGYRRVRAYSQYRNRPWERFDYETAIHTLANKFGKENKAAILSWCDKHARGEAEKVGAFLDDFKSEWDKASPGMKEALAAMPPLETEDQAKSALAVLKMGNFLRSLENAENK